MRNVLWAIMIAVGVYLIVGGLVSMYQVRAGEARLQRAIEQAILPGFYLVEHTPAEPTRDIWHAGLVGHTPVMNEFLWWKPGDGIFMSATYRTDATPLPICGALPSSGGAYHSAESRQFMLAGLPACGSENQARLLRHPAKRLHNTGTVG